MTLDYSQKRLLGKALHTRSHSKHARRLQIYAVLTGFLSMLVSLVTLIIRIVR
ncbi:MAG TPA: hypothetical protein VMV62_01690 [Candidatus Paceibacterota bacterium]|nr:hypothetical protein [Candidatus Paceibacterota bacterium]